VKDLRVVSRKTKLDSLFALGDQLERDPNSDPELRAHFAQYLCVLVAGFVEKSVISLYSEHAKRRSSPTVFAYSTSQLSRIRNPKAGMLLEIAGTFDADWRRDLEEFLNGQKTEALNSVMGNRHQIAHGTSVTLTYRQIYDYYGQVVGILDHIEKQVS